MKSRFETPGTLAIMLIYLAVFVAMWLAAYVFLAAQWATG